MPLPETALSLYRLHIQQVKPDAPFVRLDVGRDLDDRPECATASGRTDDLDVCTSHKGHGHPLLLSPMQCNVLEAEQVLAARGGRGDAKFLPLIVHVPHVLLLCRLGEPGVRAKLLDLEPIAIAVVRRNRRAWRRLKR